MIEPTEVGVPAIAWPPARIADLVQASTTAIVAEVRALGDDATVRPAPGEWCASDVIGHLIEADRHGFVGRIAVMGTEDRPLLATWDQDAVAASRADRLRDPAELLEELGRARAADLDLVRGLDAPALARVGIHPEVGELTVADVLHEWVHHDRAHLAQVLAITQALVWPRMGNARRFSAPNG